MIDLPLALAIRLEALGSRFPRGLRAGWQTPAQALRRVSRARKWRRSLELLMARRVEQTMRRPDLVSRALNLLQGVKLEVWDVGARGGPLPCFAAFPELVQLTLVEADREEALRLQRRWGRSCTVLSTALGSSKGESTLHVTRNPGGSSLFLPDPKGLREHLRRSSGADARRFEIDRRYQVPVTTLADAVTSLGRTIDILKVDTQGSESDIIRGLGHVRPLFVQLELTSDSPLYRGESPSSEVVPQMSELGYCVLVRPSGWHGDWLFLREPAHLIAGGQTPRVVVAALVLGVSNHVAHVLELRAPLSDFP